MMSKSSNSGNSRSNGQRNEILTLADLKTLKDEIRLQLQSEIKAEPDHMESTIEKMTDRCNQIEASQQFLSQTYEDMCNQLQQSKKTIVKLEGKLIEQDKLIALLKTEARANESEIDDLAQYIRRDCIEISGIPSDTNADSKEIVREICQIIDIEIDDSDISTAHPLPDTKKSKD